MLSCHEGIYRPAAILPTAFTFFCPLNCSRTVWQLRGVDIFSKLCYNKRVPLSFCRNIELVGSAVIWTFHSSLHEPKSTIVSRNETRAYNVRRRQTVYKCWSPLKIGVGREWDIMYRHLKGNHSSLHRLYLIWLWEYCFGEGSFNTITRDHHTILLRLAPQFE